MRWKCPERFPRQRLQRKLIVSDPSMHFGTCMSGSLTPGGGENVPGIPGVCAIRNFRHLARGPFSQMEGVNSSSNGNHGNNQKRVIYSSGYGLNSLALSLNLLSGECSTPSQCSTGYMSPYGVTRPHWVKTNNPEIFTISHFRHSIHYTTDQYYGMDSNGISSWNGTPPIFCYHCCSVRKKHIQPCNAHYINRPNDFVTFVPRKRESSVPYPWMVVEIT